MRKQTASVILLNAFPDKKIKSIGNKALIKISKDSLLIDYHIKFFNKIFDKPQIIIVGGFESKKLEKYISSKFSTSNIVYIEHDISETLNIGKSISEAIKHVNHNNILVANCGTLINMSVSSILSSTRNSYIVSSNDDQSKIGCILDNEYIINCFYDLPNTIHDFLYLDEKGSFILKEITADNNIDKLYLFEIINMCVHSGCQIGLLDINKKHISVLDNIKKIKSIQRKINKYV